ncbi:MAG: DMT family transporter [Pseudomonadota bacterium]
MPTPWPLWLLGLTVFGATSFIVLGDTAGKAMVMDGVSPWFVAWSRLALGALIMLPLVGLKPGEPETLLSRKVVLRATLMTAALSCILTALRTVPLSDAFGAFFVGPIVTYILAVVFLGETTSWARTGLLGIGFAGVLLVVKPGFGFTLGMGLAICAGMFWGSFLATTRWIARDHRAGFLLWSQLVIGGVILAPLGLTHVPNDWTWNTAGLVLLSALASATGNFLLVHANRHGEGSVIAPLIYTMLISATGFGFLAFGDIPDLLAALGLALILGSGLATLSIVKHRPG